MSTRTAARLIALVWAVWWMLFGLRTGLAEGLPLLGVLARLAFPGGLFLLTVAIAWRAGALGGLLLVLAGLGAHANFNGAGSLLTVFTLTAPPIIAGLLLVWHDQSSHKPGAPPRPIH